MGMEAQSAMPPRPEDDIQVPKPAEEAPVFDISTGKEAKPAVKPVEQQIRDEVHSRIASGDYSVPEFVTDSKKKKPVFEGDPGVEFLATEEKKMNAEAKEQEKWDRFKQDRPTDGSE